MFVVPSFEIYGGTKGFYDFGPPGCALKANLLALWRRHFVLEESMLEVECTNLMPHSVLHTSGHVERFTDLMVKDPANDPPCARADKLLEEHIEGLLEAEPDMPAAQRHDLETQARKAEALDEDQMHAAFQKFGIVSPAGNPWSKPFPFNLMFKTTIGPEGTMVGYLRPETAQGIFINFERLRDFNSGKLPFAAAQIGQAYRNEIAPRSGLLRVREFCQAEIEHFVDPEDKKHAKFASVSELVIPLFDRRGQLETGKTTKDWTMSKAVQEGMIDNETLAFFMSRTYLFLRRAGVHADKIRFRQVSDRATISVCVCVRVCLLPRFIPPPPMRAGPNIAAFVVSALVVVVVVLTAVVLLLTPWADFFSSCFMSLFPRRRYATTTSHDPQNTLTLFDHSTGDS
jgi:glycyl-tRNA synthetase